MEHLCSKKFTDDHSQNQDVRLATLSLLGTARPGLPTIVCTRIPDDAGNPAPGQILWCVPLTVEQGPVPGTNPPKNYLAILASVGSQGLFPFKINGITNFLK